jgi:hypothetical protein
MKLERKLKNNGYRGLFLQAKAVLKLGINGVIPPIPNRY